MGAGFASQLVPGVERHSMGGAMMPDLGRRRSGGAHVSALLWATGLLLSVPYAAAGQAPVTPAPLPPPLQATLATWLSSNGRTPEAYVTSLFRDHDVVFLGEQHRVKHDALLVQNLVPPLYQAGVHVLAIEFARREDQPLVDSLLGRKKWDEALAREIVFRHFVFWGYREYVDLFKSAWTLNQRLAKGAPQFRILGINDSPDWSIVKTEADRESPEIMKRVWRGGGENLWAAVILDAARSGEKVLVYCGIHHAFTQYRQPVVVDGKFLHFDRALRAGNHVFNAIGKRAITVYLHAPWNGYDGYDSAMRHPADGIIDSLMEGIGPHPVGFDLIRGPLGELQVKDAVYRHGYDDFRLKTFCDGWIYTKPISSYEGVTPIPRWINDDNLERARLQSPNPAFRTASVQRFNGAIARDADIPSRWGFLR
jgi:hypothetical protein